MAHLMEDDLLSSDSEDDDYVPTGADGDSEDEQSGEEEDLSLLTKDGEPADTEAAGRGKRSKKKKAKKAADVPRKRIGGIKLEGEQEATTNGETKKDDYNVELQKKIEEEKEEKKKEEGKKKADSLWSDFMKDVGGPKPKPKVTSGLGALSSLTKPKPSSSSSSAASKTFSSPAASSASASASSATTTTTKTAEKITITKEYDFAGETVKVTKEVSADSKEAKAELKKQEEKDNPTPAKPTAGPSLAALGIGIKRPGGGGGLSSVLGKLGKKPKMSTLEKSKMDWESYKQKEGITEDLATHNKGKDGYIERQNFLQRADLRQFEMEKEMRTKTRKPFLS